MFAAVLTVTADWRFARDGTWGWLRNGCTWDGVLLSPLVWRFKLSFKMHAAIVRFVTGGSYGARLPRHIIRLDASLIDNKFPLMDGRLARAALGQALVAQLRRRQRRGQEHVAQSVRESDDGAIRPPRARDDDVSPTALLFVSTRCAAIHAALPPPAVRATAAAFAMANVQAALGICTLLYLCRCCSPQHTKPAVSRCSRPCSTSPTTKAKVTA
ncbi:hypothetical protein EDB86DRAFT_3102240 [Lactarius hatsudake]|nr:hypothetical protein EDB86DRAFT_3102240 [Lactarius hatsudake]